MSRKWPWIAVGAAPCGRPFSVNHDARRARRLGAPHLAGFRPAGRPPLPAAAKEAKRRRGCPAVALWLQRGHPRTPGIYGGPILAAVGTLSGAGGTTTAPASAPLPLSVRNQDGLTGWTKRARLIAQVLISAGGNWRAGQETRPSSGVAVFCLRCCRGGPMWPPADFPPGTVSPPSRRGGACPSRRFSEFFRSTLGFRHAGRRAESSRPTDVMVLCGRPSYGTFPLPYNISGCENPSIKKQRKG